MRFLNRYQGPAQKSHLIFSLILVPGTTFKQLRSKQVPTHTGSFGFGINFISHFLPISLLTFSK
jgi:hypothetical protein